WSSACLKSSRSTRPIISSIVRKPSAAMCSRTSSARNRKKFTTDSGRPPKRLRSSGSWVAMPTGQVLRWQTRIMMQPITTSGDELHVHARLGVGVLQVVDELLDVLDRVDVVVRWWRDELDARGREADLGDPGIDLAAGELAALAGLGALRHLDL